MNSKIKVNNLANNGRISKMRRSAVSSNPVFTKSAQVHVLDLTKQ